jgi:hypothetical protein
MNVYLHAYPRSGNNFFAENYHKFVGADNNVSLIIEHDPNKINFKNKIFSIIREPIDAVSSYASLPPRVGNNFKDIADELLQEYIYTYKNLLQQDEIILYKFEDLVEKTYKVIEHSAKSDNLIIRADDGKYELPRPRDGYYITSKDTEKYKTFKRYVIDSEYVSDAYKIYRTIIGLSVIVD